MSDLQVVYTDVDATLVGPRGSFFRAEDSSLTLEPARALVELHAAGVALVLVSGRTSAQLLEISALLGADGWIAELGALVIWFEPGSPDPIRSQLLLGEAPDGVLTAPPEVLAGLLAAFSGQLELHAPWHVGHQVDVMLRGRVDPVAAESWLAEHGAGWLRLRDNGQIGPRPTPGLSPDLGPLHVYHLVPAGVGKGEAVAVDLARRGLTREQALGVGDSVSDLGMADAVGRFALVANGGRIPHVREAAAAHANVTITDNPVGLGWAEAVRAALAG